MDYCYCVSAYSLCERELHCLLRVDVLEENRTRTRHLLNWNKQCRKLYSESASAVG